MRLGILSQTSGQEEMEIFKTRAMHKGIDLRVLQPSSLVVAIQNNRTALLDSNMKPVEVEGIINWEPHPILEEVEKACLCLGIPFLNGLEAVRTARNKVLTSIALSRYGLPQPDTLYQYSTTLNNRAASLLAIPFVSKPKTGAQGRGAYRINSPADLYRCQGTRYSKAGFYLQNYIPNDGWDLRIVVVGRHVLGAIKKIAAPGEWRTHVLYGGKAVKYPVDKNLEHLSLCAAKALGLHFAGIDVIVDNRDGGLTILEVNGVPGLKIFSKTTGTCIAGAILDFMAGYSRSCIRFD